MSNDKNITSLTGLIHHTQLSGIVSNIVSTFNNKLTNLDSVTAHTWADLVALRNGKGLKAGAWYRIADYVTTTVQTQTRSAGHSFDLLVRAIGEDTLSEVASALPHEGDTYFSDARLGAWQVWYTLDNDQTRFAWADTQNGKGVIYRLIDEWENDCPYDFKNIQFHRDVTKLAAAANYLQAADGYYFTFSHIAADKALTDASLLQFSVDTAVRGNCITTSDEDSPQLSLEDNVFVCIEGLVSNSRNICNNQLSGRGNTFGGHNVYDNVMSQFDNNTFADKGYLYCNDFKMTQSCTFEGFVYSLSVSGRLENNTFKGNVFMSDVTGMIINSAINGAISYTQVSGRLDSVTFSAHDIKYSRISAMLSYADFSINPSSNTSIYGMYSIEGTMVGTASDRLKVTAQNNTSATRAMTMYDGKVVDYCPADLVSRIAALEKRNVYLLVEAEAKAAEN